jgi:hypothetical protein
MESMLGARGATSRNAEHEQKGISVSIVSLTTADQYSIDFQEKAQKQIAEVLSNW